MSRGDLTEVEWRILKVLLPVEREPGKRGRGRRPRIIATSSMAFLAAAHRGALARCAGEVRQLEFDLSAVSTMERPGVWESVAIALAETMAESGPYNMDSTTVRAHVSAAGGKGGLINELLAARGAGSPVKFIVSVMPEAGRSPSTSRPAKRRTAKHTIR